MPSSKFLDQWNDPGIEVDAAWKVADEVPGQKERLRNVAVMAYYAADVPRRLGADATPRELARDKKVCRKVQRVALNYLAQWSEDVVEEIEVTKDDEELRIKGTQVIWTTWLAEYAEDMRTHLRRVATHALRTGDIKGGNSLCNRLLNELNQMANAIEL